MKCVFLLDKRIKIRHSRCMKILKIIFVAAVSLLVCATLALWTPDTSPQAMQQKYGGEPSQFVELSNGDVVHYRDQGLRSGPVLVLIHGTSASLHTWEPMVEALKGQFRLISYDLPGHGLSGSTQDADYSSMAMVQSTWNLMAQLNIDSATLVGNSLGGSIAWRAALDDPDRVKSLILLAPSGAPRVSVAKSNIGFKILRTSLGQALMKKITPRFIIKKSLLQTVVDPAIVDEATVDRYWELLRMQGNRQAMIDLAKTPRPSDDWRRLSEIKFPALVVWGKQDDVLPMDMADTFSSELASATLHLLDDVGHLPMEEATVDVVALIQDFCQNSGC